MLEPTSTSYAFSLKSCRRKTNNSIPTTHYFQKIKDVRMKEME